MTDKKSNSGRKCSICTHPESEKINKLIAEPNNSFRHIASQTDVGYRSVARHAVDCLNLDVATVKREILESNQEYYSRHLRYLFESATKMMRANEQWLSDPENPNIYDISPRGDEIDVVYLDYKDCNNQGEPKRKKAPLAELLARIDEQETENFNVSPVSVFNKAVDNRKLMLETQKNLIHFLAQFAKTAGLEQAPRESDDTLTRIKRGIQEMADKKGISYDEELKNYLDQYAPPAIKAQLSSEMVN